MLRLTSTKAKQWLPLANPMRALAVGIAVGGTGFVFRETSSQLLRLTRVGIVSAQRDLGSAVLVGTLLIAVICAIAWTVRRWAPEAAGSGVQEVEASLMGEREIRGVRVLLAKFVGGALALGAGLPLGREGPTIHMGGALGELLHAGRKDSASGPEVESRNLALAAGAAAGLAAAFNAPLSGLMLILEEMRRQFRFSAGGLQFLALATLSADATVRLLSDNAPVLLLGHYHPPSARTLPLFLLFGVPCGLLGAAFNAVMLKALDRYSYRARGLATPLACGIALVCAWMWAPQLLGDGYDLLPNALASGTTSWALLALIVGRILATSGAFASGVPGGIFAPLVSVGVLLGCALAPPLRGLGVEVTNLQLALSGIGGMFAAMVHAPITGIVLAIELTGQLDASLPLLATAIGAASTARVVGGQPIYDELAKRMPALPKREPALPETGPLSEPPAGQ